MDICLLKWSIGNFSLCPWNERFVFRSCVFKTNATRWRFKLYSQFNRNLGNIVLFDLVRCGIRAKPKIIEATCTLVVYTKRLNNPFYRETRPHSFRIDSRLTFPHISTVKHLHRICRSKGVDDLIFVCEIITRDEGELAKRLLAGEPEFKKLSEDLNQLYENKIFCDISLEVEGHFIPVHKAILHARASGFSKLFEEMDPNQKVLSLSNVSYEILNKVIHFIYTGKLSIILSTPPCSAVYRIAKRFGVRELEEIFALHEIASSCIIETKFCSLRWLATDIHLYRRVSDHILSPWFKNKDPDIPSWRLVVFPLGNEDSSEHIAIFIELSDWPEDAPIAFRISLADHDGNLLFPKSAISFTNSRGICGFQHFVERAHIPPSLLYPFRIHCLITFPTHNLLHSTRDYKEEIVSDRACQHREFNVLFKTMRDLYENPKYCDMFLEVEGFKYPAHKYILSTRSRVLGDMISRLRQDENQKPALRLNMSRDAGKQIIQYIYYGKINMFEPHVRSEIFHAADRYGLQDLKLACIQFIKEFSRGALSGSSSSS